MRYLITIFVFFALTSPAIAAPDLIVAAPTQPAQVQVQDRYFDQYDTCSVTEGFIPSLGWHRLLSFDTNVANVGADDLRIGNPAAHPEWFTYSTCHHHYHAPLADYQLLDAAGTVVAQGHKMGFCLTDSFIYDPTIARTRAQFEDCAHKQGISRGWADSYTQGLAGQWVVIDGVPSGTYTLRVQVNYQQVFPESDYANDVSDVQVVIP